MLALACTELCKHWKRILLTALEIAVVLFLTVVLVTTLQEQSKTYRPFRKLLEKEGVHIAWGDIADEESVLQSLQNVESAVLTRQCNWYVDGKSQKHLLTVFYDETVSSYYPDLAEGVWYTEAKGDGETLEAVITQNNYGIRVGDVIEVRDMFDKEDAASYRVHICGMLEEGAKFYKATGWTRDGGVDAFFDIASYRENLRFYLFLSHDVLADRNIRTQRCPQVLLQYADDIAEEEKEANRIRIESQGGIVGHTFAEIREETLELIAQKLFVLLPVAVGAFFLVSLSVAGSAAIGTMRSLETYGVFYLCGMKWRGCVLLGGIQAAGTGVLSVAMLQILHALLRPLGLAGTFLFEYGTWQMLVCLVILLYMTVLSCLLPYCIIKKHPPIEVLRSSKV